MEYVILIVVIAALLTALVIGFRNRNAAEKGQVLAVDAGGPWAKKARPVPKPHAPPFLPKADAGPQPTGKSAGGAVQVFIHYKDANGYESKRRITLRKVASAGDGAYITAYCHEREGVRHFYSDRIIELVDTETGEIFDDAMDFLTPLYFGADDFADMLSKCAAGITLLVALGRSDGRFTLKEKDVIAYYMRQFSGGKEFNRESVDKYLAKQRPTAADISDAIVDIRDWTETDIRPFIIAAKVLSEIDGIVHEGEKKILASLYALFNVEWED